MTCFSVTLLFHREHLKWSIISQILLIARFCDIRSKSISMPLCEVDQDQ